MFLIRNIRFSAIFHAPPRRSSSASIARGPSLSVGFLLIRPSPPTEKEKAARRVRLGHPTAPPHFFQYFSVQWGEVMAHRAHRPLYIRRDLKTSQGPQFRKGGCVDVYGGMFRSPLKNLWPRRRCQSRVRLGAARRIRECF